MTGTSVTLCQQERVGMREDGAVDLCNNVWCETKTILITTQAKRNLSSRSGIGGVLSAT